MTKTYETFAQVSEYYASASNNATETQKKRLQRLSTTASVLEELTESKPIDRTINEGLLGVTIDQLMERLEEGGIQRRNQPVVMGDVHVIGFDLDLRLYLDANNQDRRIKYKPLD